MSYLLEDSIFDNSIYSTNNNNNNNNSHADFNHNDHPIYGSHQLTLSQALGLPSSSTGTPAKVFPTFDPDSPFNSPIVPIKVPGKDGRLKTRLSGVGAEGGYLVSPMVVNKARMGGMVGTPEIAIASPGPSHNNNHNDGYNQGDMHGLGEMGTGMGIGIDGLDLDGYGNPNVRMYGLPRQPTNLATVDTLPNSPEDLVGFRIASPPPSQSTSANTLDAQKRPKKNLSVRTINKAKSCSALSPSKARAAVKHNPAHEPLTPVSIEHSPSGFSQPGAPFNSPVDAILAEQEMANMPFSFEALYDMGLAQDSLEQIDPRKSPYAFTNDLLNAENGTLGLGVSTAPHDEFAGLHMLPTPSLQHSSNFPSPGTPYQQSPEMIGLGYTNGAGGQPMMNAPSMHSVPSMSSASGMSGSSLDDMYRQNTNGFIQPQRRTVSYNPATHHHMLSPEMMISPQLMNQQVPNRSRQPSNQAAYGGPNAKYAYPSRLAHGHPHQHHHQHQYPAPPMSWTNSNTSNYSQMDSSLFVPGFDQRERRAQEDYQRSLHDFENDIYERYSQQSNPYGHPSGKRSRQRDEVEYDDYDEEDEIERAGEEFDYVNGPQTFSPNGHPLRHSASQKRLRTVASAPNLNPPGLPTNLPALPTRRMRPGPKPKSLQSPQEQHQSVFSAILSPPQLQQGFRRSVSPFPQGDGSGAGSDDEGDGASSLPKGYIQSLYRGVPSHTDASGTKQPKRYLCLMDGCDRTFPRKSAIESHIQTHLEDKPFVCPHADCDASFVRQHDLRRHERIHSGNKPFPCPCGKGFARGDALARHRARGICAGSLVPRRI